LREIETEEQIKVMDVCGQLLQLLSVAVLHADGGQYWQHMAWEFGLGK